MKISRMRVSLMKNDLKEICQFILLILIAIIFYRGLNNISVISNCLKIVIKVLMSFLLGDAFAFILNIPMVKIENLKKITI